MNTSIALEQTHQFSTLFQDYILKEAGLSEFFRNSPELASFNDQFSAKSGSYQNREILVSVLQRQNEVFVLHNKQLENLNKLQNSNCFTVTTGHQLCLATGPVYFIYKILTVIRLAEDLKKEYPEQEIVPVFWMATEDHDLEEINHFYLFGKKYEWTPKGKGPAGRISTEGLEEVFSTVPDCPVWLKECYTQSATLAEATRKLVNHLFGEHGILVIDGDDQSLKQLFREQIQSDLLHTKYAPLVRDTSAKLEQKGYKAQAFVRDQNFFVIQPGARERIEKEQEHFKILNTEKTLSVTELKQTIQDNPEEFSPNVLLRPLYQEVLLPNLAYIGGPGELAYWLQLKRIFDAELVPFPILFPRQFITLLPKTAAEKLVIADLQIEQLFLPVSDFRSLLLEKLKVEKFDFLEEEQLLKTLREMLQQKAARADKSLLPAIEAEIAKTTKSISELGKRMNKAMEAKNETELSKLENIRKKIFPEGQLQERHENFLSFFINKPDFISFLYQQIAPFDFSMHCLTL